MGVIDDVQEDFFHHQFKFGPKQAWYSQLLSSAANEGRDSREVVEIGGNAKATRRFFALGCEGLINRGGDGEHGA